MGRKTRATTVGAGAALLALAGLTSAAGSGGVSEVCVDGSDESTNGFIYLPDGDE